MVAPPRKTKGQRVRAVRSDKGEHHSWTDGRQQTAVYKLNKKNKVNWSEVRCRANTCWKTKTRRTDYEGEQAYRNNVEEDHYVKQLRRKKRQIPYKDRPQFTQKDANRIASKRRPKSVG